MQVCGKQLKIYVINSMKKLGIEIRGSNVKFILLGKVIEHTSVIKSPTNKKTFFKSLHAALMRFPMSEISSIGVGIPGIVERKSGEILAVPNLTFLKGMELKKELSKYKKKL